MPNEAEIKELAYKIWEDEGKPEGKDVENYFRAARILEEQGAPHEPALISAPEPIAALPPAAPTPLLKPMTATKRKTTPGKKKSSSFQ
jgi:hypothetical protein